MKNKRIYFLAALALTLAILTLLQALVTPKYMGDVKEGALIGEYYANAGENDVVFIGDCEVYENFSPITLWEEYGIPSYIRGSAQQMIWQSYYLMEETFRYETPRVMVFNVLSMKYDTNHSTGAQSQREAYNRMTLDGMRLSRSKWDSIFASMTEEERAWEAQFSYLFPLLRYHDRWSQLTKEDFRYLFHRPEVSDNGYLMQVGVKPFTDEFMERPLVDYSFGETSWEYLENMRQLCETHGTELVLIKAPALSPVWWDEWDTQIEAYAAEHGLRYINMLDHINEMGIDWQTDTYDTGLHLNVYGAEKAAKWFGHLLAEEFDLPDRRTDPTLAEHWEAKCETYYARKAKLEAEHTAK